MGSQGALTPCGVVTNLDDALAAGQCIAIRSFRAVRTREASESSPALVPLRLHLRQSNVEEFAHNRVWSRLSRQPDVKNLE